MNILAFTNKNRQRQIWCTNTWVGMSLRLRPQHGIKPLLVIERMILTLFMKKTEDCKLFCFSTAKN